MNIQEKTALVVGGSGKTGRRVARRLMARGIPVRSASRSGSTRFDWADRGTWADALRGVASAYITYSPDLAAPGALEDIRELTKLAVDSGVRKLVLLSGRGEPQAARSEQPVRDSGATFTILRASWFCQNFSEGMMLDAVRSGEVAFPAGDVAEPFIDVEDVAEIAVAALTSDAHDGTTYELTGPRLLTFAQAVDEIARASGKAVRYVPVTPEEYGAAMASFVSPEQAAFFVELFRRVLDGHNAHTSDGVERVLGRKGREFSEYAREVAASGVWGEGARG
ncbi:MAG TPA: hypothetical protein VFT22_04870 [Kofleriaceae bacterium]|nr:hypothetical protein [Kofleriaceae bacterium]